MQAFFKKKSQIVELPQEIGLPVVVFEQAEVGPALDMACEEEGFHGSEASDGILSNLTDPGICGADGLWQGTQPGIPIEFAFQLRQQPPGAVQKQQRQLRILGGKDRRIHLKQDITGCIKGKAGNGIMEDEILPVAQWMKRAMGVSKSGM